MNSSRPKRFWTAAIAAAICAFVVTAILRPTSPASPTLPTALDAAEPAVQDLIRETRETVASEPRSAQAWGTYGMALHNAGFQAEALAAFEQAARQDANDPRWPFFLSDLQLGRDDTAALAHLERCVSLIDGEPESPRLVLSELLVERGRFKEARQHLDRILKNSPGHPLGTLLVARIAFLQQDIRGCIERLPPCLTNDYTAKAAYTLMGAAQQRMDNTEAARTADRFAQSLPRDRVWPNPYILEARQHLAGRRVLIEECQARIYQGQFEAALPLVERLITHYPEAPEGWLYLGRIQLLRQNYPAARDAFAKHLSLKPDSVDGRIQMGLLHLQLREYAPSIQSLQQAVDLKPDSDGAHYNLGLARLRSGDRSGAIVAFERARECRPSFIEAYLTLAQIHQRDGRTEDALKELQLAMTINPFDVRTQKMLEDLGRQQEQD